MLTFEILDEFVLATGIRGIDCGPHLATTKVARIGPLIELLVQERTRPIGYGALPSSPSVLALNRALTAGASTIGEHVNHDLLRLGFIATRRDRSLDDQTPWFAFCSKAQQAAEHAGMPKPIAQGLVGAIQEIEENVHLHSRRAKDGVVGYRSDGQQFEFVVADSGTGALNSLRENVEYRAMTDAGRALDLVLSDGVSRFGSRSGHGYGFRPLFTALANLNGELRFRSGDHALTIDGRGPSLPSRRLVQKFELRGFVASVICRL